MVRKRLGKMDDLDHISSIPNDIVYALSNRSMAGIVKIGRTTRSAELRSAELFTTGVPEPFEVEAAYEVLDGTAVEAALHRAFAPYRVYARREFFRVEAYQVEAILRLLGTSAAAKNITEEVAENPALIPGENIFGRARRPRGNLLAMGIPLGAEISFSRFPATARVKSAHTIEFNGSEMSLTAATRTLLPSVQFGNAFKLWKFEDRSLMEIYDETYPVADGCSN